MSKFSKHLGTGEPVMIDGEEFILKPLTVDYIPHFFKAMKAFSGAKEDATMEEIFKNVTDDGLEAIKTIITVTLNVSYPNEDKEELMQFGLKYMMILLPKIMEINSAQDTGGIDVAKKKIDRLKAMRDKKKQSDKDVNSG